MWHSAPLSCKTDTSSHASGFTFFILMDLIARTACFQHNSRNQPLKLTEGLPTMDLDFILSACMHLENLIPVWHPEPICAASYPVINIE